jgi:hypothetical protein
MRCDGRRRRPAAAQKAPVYSAGPAPPTWKGREDWSVSNLPGRIALLSFDAWMRLRKPRFVSNVTLNK